MLGIFSIQWEVLASALHYMRLWPFLSYLVCGWILQWYSVQTARSLSFRQQWNGLRNSFQVRFNRFHNLRIWVLRKNRVRFLCCFLSSPVHISALQQPSKLLTYCPLGGLSGRGRLNSQVCRRLICSIDRDEVIFVAGIGSNCGCRFFADAGAFHISFCEAHEALIDTEGYIHTQYFSKVFDTVL